MAAATVPPADYNGYPANSTPSSQTISLTILTGDAGGKTTGDR